MRALRSSGNDLVGFVKEKRKAKWLCDMCRSVTNHSMPSLIFNYALRTDPVCCRGFMPSIIANHSHSFSPVGKSRASKVLHRRAGNIMRVYTQHTILLNPFLCFAIKVFLLVPPQTTIFQTWWPSIMYSFATWPATFSYATHTDNEFYSNVQYYTNNYTKKLTVRATLTN